jgi:hypothetical protein
MNRPGYWLADKLALALEPHERDALQGDHAELGASGLQAAWDVGGLVVRRQLEPWTGWRPGCVLVTLDWPFLLFVIMSLAIGRGTAHFALMKVDTSSFPFGLVVAALLVTLCSWNCSFTLALLSGRLSFVNQALFWMLACLFVGVWARSSLRRFEAGPTEIAFEILAFVVVFAIPALTGLRTGRAEISPSGLVRASRMTAPAAIIALLWAFYLFLGPGPKVVLFLAISWPGVWICGRYLRSLAPGAPCPR